MGEEVENKIIINYSDIPNFPISTVEGHKSRFIFGTLNNKKVAVMQGRFHFYEGYKMQEVVFPVWVMKALGNKQADCYQCCWRSKQELYTRRFDADKRSY